MGLFYILLYLFKLCLWVCFLISHTNCYGFTNQEYCQGEFFAPQCNENEIVIVTGARYGHIQLGRCLDTDLGYLGCSMDELSYLDKQCSGKNSCNVVISDTSMGKDLPCASSLLRYLEASFHCNKVFQANEDTCSSSVKVSVKSRIKHLASSSTQNFGCGTETKPWILEAKPGQHINISLTDFNWKPAGNSPLKCPLRYGYIIDIQENTVIDICGGADRIKHVYLSMGSQLQVVLDKSILGEATFVLSYQAIGCPTYSSPKDTWMKEDSGVITVGCHHNTQKWNMRCIGNNWIGIVGNCQTASENVRVIDNLNEENDRILGMSPVVAYSLLGSVFVIIICVTITIFIGIACIRKPKRLQNEYYLTAQPSGQTTMLIQGSYPTYRPVEARNITQDTNQTLMSPHNNDMHDVLSQARTPHYYMLENRDEHQAEPIYDAVYQNTGQNAAL